MAEGSGGGTSTPPPGYTGIFNGVMYQNGQEVSLPTTPPTSFPLPDGGSYSNPTSQVGIQTPGSNVGPEQYQGSGGAVVNYPYQPASTQNQIISGNTQGLEVSPEQQAQIDASIAAMNAHNDALRDQSSSTGTAPSTGEGQRVPSAPPPLDFPGAPTLPQETPAPPTPQDITGYTPTTPPSRSQVFGQHGDQGNSDQSFASLIPRIAGNNVNSPSDISGTRPNVPAWAAGLARSPYSRFLARGGQGSSFGAMPGFQDIAPVDAEQRRIQEMAGLPAWAQSV